MIGAVVYQLRAEQSALLPVVHGKWLHAVLFHEMAKYSTELSDKIHGTNAIKPFSISELFFKNSRNRLLKSKQVMFRRQQCWKIEEGERFFWRVSALQEEVLKFLLHFKTGSKLKIKNVVFNLEAVIADPGKHNDSGLLTERDLILHCLEVPEINSITFHFLSPVSFRVNTQDEPLPRPELIFGSIADKWNQNKMPVPVKRNEIGEMGSYCRLTDWVGNNVRRFYGTKHGINGFEGKFTFDVTELNENDKRLLLLLAQFSVFSGVGRLTGQGMGQTRVSYC